MTVFDGMWETLATVGRAPSGGYRRFAWTREDADLRDWFAGEAAARGLDVVTDRAGNQWAWWGDPDAEGPGVVLGSHLDSVPDGGAFDGPLGVVSAFAALDVLRARGVGPGRPVAVAHFADEEGARFGVACAGSRLLTGSLDADRARGLRDVDGVTLAEAMARAGHDPAHLGPDPDALRRIGVYVELHVEQGRGLADTAYAVGVGSAIHPHGRWRLTLRGRADHAGTTRLADRADPMLALAEVVLATRAAAVRHEALATVGKVVVAPNGVNAIPSLVTAWLDARGADEERVRAVAAAVAEVARRHGGTVGEESWSAAVAFDTGLTARVAAAVALAGGAGSQQGDTAATQPERCHPAGIPVLPTGAGHDAGILAGAGVPAAMLFVRNPTGVSHSPEEHAEPADCHAGVAALAAVAEDLTRDPA